MTTYTLLDPNGKKINTFNETDKADMEKMGLAPGYNFVSGSTSKPATGSGEGAYTLQELSKDLNAGNIKSQADVDKRISERGYSSDVAGNIPPKSLAEKTQENIKTLPDAPRSSLVDFADTLNQATTLARTRRRESEMGILDQFGFEPGKVRAGTMGNILNLLDKRAESSHEVAQNAAIDAFKSEQVRKDTDKTNIQNLALQLLTSGDVDQAGVNAILGSGSLDSAMGVAAGLIKGSDAKVTDVRMVNGSLVKIFQDGTAEKVDIQGMSDAENVEYDTYTSDGVIYQYKKDKTTGKIIGEVETIGGESGNSKPTIYKGEEALSKANEFVLLNQEAYKTGEKSRNEFFLYLKSVTDLSDGEVNKILDEGKIFDDDGPSDEAVKNKAAEITVSVWDKDWWKFEDKGELKSGKEDAINAINNPDHDNYESDPATRKRLMDAINSLSYDDVKVMITAKY